MSLHSYQRAMEMSAQDEPFYALIMAAMVRADSDNIEMLKSCWPDTWAELDASYHASGGILEGESA